MRGVWKVVLPSILLTCMALSDYGRDDPATAPVQHQPATTGQPPVHDQTERQRQPNAESRCRTRLRLGTISVGASYTYFSGPLDGYPWYAYGNSPVFWSPFWSYLGPLYSPPYFTPGNGTGAVKLHADPKSAQVFIDNAYAGTAARLKSFWLDPGAYDLTVTAQGRAPYRQRIYVLSGRTLKITGSLQPETAEVAP
jgi:hypothetical protein